MTCKLRHPVGLRHPVLHTNMCVCVLLILHTHTCVYVSVCVCVCVMGVCMCVCVCDGCICVWGGVSAGVCGSTYCIHTYVYVCVYVCMATISRLLKHKGLFCERAL